MTMRPYNRTTRSFLSLSLVIKSVLVGVLVLLFVVIIRALLGNRQPIPLSREALLQKFDSRAVLEERINTLEDERAAWVARLQEVELLQKENKSLKAELGRTVDVPGILARVVATPEKSFYDTLVIDAGSADGIIEGAVAYAFDSIALGTVSSVGEHRAVIELFSAPDRQTAGSAEGSETTITLIGRGGGEYEVRMPRDIHFSTGELVSLQTVRTAVLAKIEKVVTDPRDPFQRLLAKAPVNLNALKFVIVK